MFKVHSLLPREGKVVMHQSSLIWQKSALVSFLSHSNSFVHTVIWIFLTQRVRFGSLSVFNSVSCLTIFYRMYASHALVIGVRMDLNPSQTVIGCGPWSLTLQYFTYIFKYMLASPVAEPGHGFLFEMIFVPNNFGFGWIIYGS